MKTGELEDAGTDAEVSLTLYGSDGDSGSRLLKAGTGNFQPGKVSGEKLILSGNR